MSGGFGGRVALITGAAGGIGAATARRLAEEGASLVLVGRSSDLERTMAERTGSDASPHQPTSPASSPSSAATMLPS